jgi:hypothetical protein
MRTLLLLLALSMAACDEPATTPPTPPVPYPFENVYACTLSGVQTRTYQDGSVDTIVAPPNTYTVDTQRAVISIPSAALYGVLLNSGRQSGTVVIDYDPNSVPEGALFQLTWALHADFYFWNVNTAGTLTETTLTGTCVASTP